ncbi:MAG: tetratricopeptide repeat protein [bacterium]|nr:tetratricopeptide repeat protein [bacterium]
MNRVSTEKLTKRFKKAVQLEKDNNVPAALCEYISIIKEDKSHREAFLNLGALYSRMNRLEDAMKCYRQVLHLGEDYLTWFNIGSIHYKMGEYKKAVINLERSKTLNSNFALSSLVMGLCFSRLNNIRAAEKNFVEVLKVWPGNRVALTALAIIYYNNEKYDFSMKFLNKLLQIDPSNYKIRELKSTILYRTGNIDESAEELKNIKKVSDGYRYYDDFIQSVPVEAYDDRYGSINEKIEFLKERTDDSDNLISLSLCHLLKGETDVAIDYLFEAKKRVLN